MLEHGKIIAVLNPQQGISPRSGQHWYSQSYVLEIDGRYTRRVAFSLWGLEANQRANLQVGKIVDVLAEVEAHEYQGKWFNEVRAYDIQINGQSIIRGNFMPAQPQPSVQNVGYQQQAVQAQPAQYPSDMGPMAQQQMQQSVQAYGQQLPTPQVPSVNPRPYDNSQYAPVAGPAPY